MFSLKACKAMGWVTAVTYDGQFVALSLANGKVVTYSLAEFGRMYRW